MLINLIGESFHKIYVYQILMFYALNILQFLFGNYTSINLERKKEKQKEKKKVLYKVIFPVNVDGFCRNSI